MTVLKAVSDSRSAEQTRKMLWDKRLELEAHRASRRRGRGLYDRLKSFIFHQVLDFIITITGVKARGMANALKPVTNRMEFSFPDLPSAFDGFTILQLTDIHFRDDEKFMSMLCNTAREHQADLCILTGDFWFEKDGPDEEVVQGMEKLVDAISARHGILAILGNNDSGRCVEKFGKLGVNVLVNEHIAIEQDGEKICIAGVDDTNWFMCHDVGIAFDGSPDDVFRILLAHSPEIVKEALEHNISLYICGHTHGGQIRFPGLPPLVTNIRAEGLPYFQGRWSEGKMQGYTSVGIGSVSVPVRFNCPPEAAIITLRRA